MNLNLDQMVYSFGKLDIVFLTSNNIQASGSSNEVSGFGTTKGFKLDSVSNNIIISVYINIAESDWGKKLFKLEINNNVIKPIIEQQDSHDPSFVEFNKSSSNEMKYTFPIPTWLKSNNYINKFQIVISAMRKADIIFKDFEII